MGRVRSKTNALARLFDESPSPVYAVDQERTIVYCNAACGRLLGLEPDELIGRRCEYRSPSDSTPGELAACLCPPPEVLTGRIVTGEITVSDRSGEPHRMCAHFAPLGADPLQCAGVLAVLYDPEDRDRRWSSAKDVELDAAALHQRLVELSREMLARSLQLDELVGTSSVIRRVREQVRVAATNAARVVVQGPSGCGREHVARAIHCRRVPRQVGPLVPVCCPLMDAELLQTTIRAYVRQFDSADTDSIPALLLLEADQLPEEAQQELAGFLNLSDFRLYTVATARRSLIALARENRFREDLAHALSTLVIELPPLSERREDIPLLCQYFVEQFNRGEDRQLSGFTPAALDELTGYDWPGNLDELVEVVEETCRKAEGPAVDVGDLPDRIRWAAAAEAHPARVAEPIELDRFLAEVESELIRRALRLTKGNKTKAAGLLGVTRARLHRRLEQLEADDSAAPAPPHNG